MPIREKVINILRVAIIAGYMLGRIGYLIVVPPSDSSVHNNLPIDCEDSETWNAALYNAAPKLIFDCY